MKKFFAVLMTVALVAVLCWQPWPNENDSLVVSENAWELFQACYKLRDKKREAMPVSVVLKEYGTEIASQYAGSINYFYDTGDYAALNPAYSLNLHSPSEADVGEIVGTRYVDYVPGSASNEVVVTEQPFPDVPVDAWYAEAVAAMKDSGIITGCDDGLFHPEREVTVGEWCTLLLRAGTKRDANVFGAGTYDHWATGAVQMADALSLTSSFVRGQYCSGIENEFVNRGEAAKGVARLSMSAYNPDYDRLLTPQYAVKQVYAIKKAELEGHPLKVWTGPDIPDWNVITGPNDSVGPHSWRSDLILRLYNLGYVKGTDGNGTFDPWKTLTRAEVAQMLYNAHFDTRDYACLPNKGTGWNFYPDKFQ